MTKPGTIVIESTWLGSTVIIGCSGDLDVTTAAILEDTIDQAVASEPAAIVVDLTEVDFLAARGMNVLTAVQDRLRDSVKVLVVADGPRTRRPMTLIGLDSQVGLHPTRAAALAALDSGPMAAATV